MTIYLTQTIKTKKSEKIGLNTTLNAKRKLKSKTMYSGNLVSVTEEYTEQNKQVLNQNATLMNYLLKYSQSQKDFINLSNVGKHRIIIFRNLF